MLSKQEFTGQVADVYKHLYDMVGLRTHPLTDALVPDPALSRKDKAARLHRLLLEAIEDLNPGPQAPAFSREWRRHRLMALRYVYGLDPETVATRLSISSRQYYREHEDAIEGVAAVLWEPYTASASAAGPEPPPQPGGMPSDGLELLRLEAARMAQSSRSTRVADVLPGVSALLQERMVQRRLELDVRLPEGLPGISPGHSLLRQLLLGMMSYLVERSEAATLRLEAQTEAATVRLVLRVRPETAVSASSPEAAQERVSTLRELAAVSGIYVEPLVTGEAIVGFDVCLPSGRPRTILVVDDNEDVLALFQRYLSMHQYHVVTAQSSAAALALARQVQPQAITLDLMMPGQDGWDTLQTLQNLPETRDIPVIVCSVLKEKELALSLGAVAFLAKPVTEQALLAVLHALE